MDSGPYKKYVTSKIAFLGEVLDWRHTGWANKKRRNFQTTAISKLVYIVSLNFQRFFYIKLG